MVRSCAGGSPRCRNAEHPHGCGEKTGAKTHVSLPVIREDFLDGKLELEVNIMTGSAIGIDRIRVIPENQ